MRMLRLSGLDSDDMTDDQRDAFVNMAENLGIEPGDAEDLVDLYLEEIEEDVGSSSAETVLKAAAASVAEGAAATQPPPVQAPTATAVVRPLRRTELTSRISPTRSVRNAVRALG